MTKCYPVTHWLPCDIFLEIIRKCDWETVLRIYASRYINYILK